MAHKSASPESAHAILLAAQLEEIGRLKTRIAELELQLHNAERDRDQFSREAHQALVLQFSAQRGLAEYMEEHGLGDRIGYDVRKDPAVLAKIAARDHA